MDVVLILTGSVQTHGLPFTPYIRRTAVHTAMSSYALHPSYGSAHHNAIIHLTSVARQCTPQCHHTHYIRLAVHTSMPLYSSTRRIAVLRQCTQLPSWYTPTARERHPRGSRCAWNDTEPCSTTPRHRPESALGNQPRGIRVAVVEARAGTVQKMASRQSQLLVASYEADRRKPPAVDEPGTPRPAKSCDGLGRDNWPVGLRANPDGGQKPAVPSLTATRPVRTLQGCRNQASTDSRTAVQKALQFALNPGGHPADPRRALTNSKRTPPLLCTQPSNSPSILELLSRLSRQTDTVFVTSSTEKTVREVSMKTQSTICATEKHIIFASSFGVRRIVGTKAETTAVGTSLRHMSKSTRQKLPPSTAILGGRMSLWHNSSFWTKLSALMPTCLKKSRRSTADRAQRRRKLG